jgi:hypothetical protein
MGPAVRTRLFHSDIGRESITVTALATFSGPLKKEERREQVPGRSFIILVFICHF